MKNKLLSIITLLGLVAFVSSSQASFVCATYAAQALGYLFSKKSERPFSAEKHTATLKNGEQIELSAIQSFYERKQAINILHPAFADDWLGFLISCQTGRWISARLATPEGIKVVGAALYQEDEKGEITLSYLGVSSSYQNQGIGKALLEYLQKATQCTRIQVCTSEAARNFYLKSGFQPDGQENSSLLYKQFDRLSAV